MSSLDASVRLSFRPLAEKIEPTFGLENGVTSAGFSFYDVGMKEKNSKKTGLWTDKRVQKALDAIKSPAAVGLYVTCTFLYLSYTFYEIRAQNESNRTPNAVFDAIEFIDLKTQDARFKTRGEVEPQSRVALLTIDDRAVEEIGRWPWSREKISHVIEKMMGYGAKAVGFDIIFSEAQVDPTVETLEKIEKRAGSLPSSLQTLFAEEKSRGQPDQILAATFAKHTDKLVLGAFNEESRHNYNPFQDYCRNSAFKRANAEKFVKITNLSFIVDDTADPFVELNFDPVFDQIFGYIEKTTSENLLKQHFQKKSVEELTSLEARQLQYSQEEAVFNYCDRWLTADDELLEASQDAYGQIFQKNELLKGLDIQNAIAKFKSEVKAHPVVQHSRWTINTDRLQEGASYTASFNAEQDSDGTIRKASLFFRTGNKTGLSFIPSLALQTYLIATGYRADVEIGLDPKNKNQKIISKFTIKDPSKDPEVEIGDVPVDEQGRMKINYAGGTSMYPYLSAKELFNDRPDAEVTQMKYDPDHKRWYPVQEKVNKAEFIKDRTFLIGATAIGIYDLRVTPFEKNYPGPETHVNALGNLFERNFIRTYQHEERNMLIALGVVGMLFSFALAYMGAVPGLLVSVVAGIAVFAYDQWLLRQGYAATMALPAILVVTLYFALTFYKYFTEERKKKQLRSTFSKYVSPAIVDEILKDPENIELGGKKQRMSVFFSDVRGFTTMSEKLDPERLSDVLNIYLTPMTNLVFANKGTLDKYMGDAVMGFFGAPIYYSDHAKYACRCALQSLVKLRELQPTFRAIFKEHGLPDADLDIGIGINTGDMSVGNMGSDIVRSYTVMGDAVNLGSRLEGINKEYGTRIIISEFTQSEVKDSFTSREVDWVRVKGKYKPVRIFELICEGPPPADKAPMLNFFNTGFNLYHDKKFEEAKQSFAQALQALPGDPVSTLYLERCEEYLQNPPPEEWDGVYVMKTK